VDPKTSNVYVADFCNERIQEFTSDGKFITKWGNPGTADGQLNSPTDVAIDPKTNSVYVTDRDNNRIQVFSRWPTNLTITNQPPVAYTISEPPAREGQQHVYLNGSGEDLDGDKLSYSWRQIAGQPRVGISNETDPIASFSAPSNLTNDTNLTFELTVYDNRGFEDKSNTTVTVLNDRNNDAQVFLNKGFDLLTLGRSY